MNLFLKILVSLSFVGLFILSGSPFELILFLASAVALWFAVHLIESLWLRWIVFGILFFIAFAWFLCEDIDWTLQNYTFPPAPDWVAPACIYGWSQSYTDTVCIGDQKFIQQGETPYWCPEVFGGMPTVGLWQGKPSGVDFFSDERKKPFGPALVPPGWARIELVLWAAVRIPCALVGWLILGWPLTLMVIGACCMEYYDKSLPVAVIATICFIAVALYIGFRV